MDDDNLYVEVLLEPLRKCARYRPAFGQEGDDGITLDEFARLYGSDPLYHWVGLDSQLMYAAHKAAGGMTSIYRQLGIGCERFFREVLSRTLNLSRDEVTWGYDIVTNNTTRRLTLDARIDLNFVRDSVARQRIRDWLDRVSIELGMDDRVARQIHGAVFEVRQGYKSADSKRQNADLASGMRAYTDGYLPVMMLFSRQMSGPVERRYRTARLLVLIGQLTGTDTESTFSFCKDVVGYDAAAFFERNADKLRAEFISILSTLLSPA